MEPRAIPRTKPNVNGYNRDVAPISEAQAASDAAPLFTPDAEQAAKEKEKKYVVTVHRDTNRYWWVIVGRLNGLDATYSEARYTTENRARAAAWRFVARWSVADLAASSNTTDCEAPG